MWHPMGHWTSQSGVQQEDPLGSLFLHQCCSAIDAGVIEMLYLTWYHNDGVLDSSWTAVHRDLHLIEARGCPSQAY